MSYLAAIILIVLVVCLAFAVLSWTAEKLNFRIDPDVQNSVLLFGLLPGACLAVFWFVLHFGNQQFGGFDDSVLIDVGWRLVNGQHPYTDFYCTLPPGFILGVKYGFALWGTFWKSQLYITAIFTVISFVWLFLLFDQLLRTRVAALVAALSIECVSNLLVSFWWYNPTASVAGSIFVLSCVLYGIRPRPLAHQLSLVASLALLALMKPNTAAPLIIGLLFVLLSGKYFVRTALLSLLACLAVVALLSLNHINPLLLIESYRAAARSRGLTLFGIRTSNRYEMLMIGVLCLWLFSPFFLAIGSVLADIRTRDYRSLRVYLMLLFGPLTAVYAMVTNGEYKFVDMDLLIASGAVLAFGREHSGLPTPVKRRLMSKPYLAVLCSLALIGIDTGVIRRRVASTGPYFELPANQETGNPFFADLKTGAQLVNVMREVKTVLQARRQASIFFGPRMEFAYAAFGLPSPKYLPIWWHPGTSFPKADQSAILQTWGERRFGTLIFLKDDFTYYPPEFMAMIDRMYVKDEHYPELTVFYLN